MNTSTLRTLAKSCGLLASLTTFSTTARAQVVAGTLNVDLSAGAFSTGNPWVNAGAYGGQFDVQGTPRAGSVFGAPAVIFDGSDALRSTFAVTDLVGGASRTVEVWAYQNGVRSEESLVAWSRRGGGDGTNESFNWSANREWGAHGGWGANADMGWNPVAGNNPGSADDLTNMPTLGSWHHLVYTYDSASTTMSFYDNGVLKNSQALNSYGGGALALNTHSGFNMVIGGQTANVAAPGTTDGGGTGQGTLFTGAIGQVRVHTGVLSAADVLGNYNLSAANYGGPSGAQLTTGPAHRYTFNGLASANDGDTVPDLVGGAHGVIRGGGATVFGASGLDLPGGSSATQAYVDLPNGLLSSRTNVTLEAWVTTQSTQNWSRIMDFGTGSDGEILGPGVPDGSSAGSNYFFINSSNGTSTTQRLERVGRGVPAGSLNTSSARDTLLSVNHGIEDYYAIVFDDAADEWRYYRNGLLTEVLPDTNSLSALTDVNSWLGRSQFSGDANLDAILNEFRISDYVLSDAEIYGNYLAGADVVNLIPEPSSAAVIVLGASVFLIRRRRTR